MIREHVWNISNTEVSKDFAIYSIHSRVVRYKTDLSKCSPINFAVRACLLSNCINWGTSVLCLNWERDVIIIPSLRILNFCNRDYQADNNYMYLMQMSHLQMYKQQICRVLSCTKDLCIYDAHLKRSRAWIFPNSVKFGNKSTNFDAQQKSITAFTVKESIKHGIKWNKL